MRHSILTSILLFPLSSSSFAIPLPFHTGKLHHRRAVFEAVPGDLANAANKKTSVSLFASHDDITAPLLSDSSALNSLEGSPGKFPDELLKDPPPEIKPSMIQEMKAAWALNFIFFQALTEYFKKMPVAGRGQKPVTHPDHDWIRVLDAMSAKNAEAWMKKHADVAEKIAKFRGKQEAKYAEFLEAQERRRRKNPGRPQHKFDTDAQRYRAEQHRKMSQYIKKQKAKVGQMSSPWIIHHGIRWEKKATAKKLGLETGEGTASATLPPSLI